MCGVYGVIEFVYQWHAIEDICVWWRIEGDGEQCRCECDSDRVLHRGVIELNVIIGFLGDISVVVERSGV